MKLHEMTKKSQHDRRLDALCNMVENGQNKDPEYWGMVAACVVDPEGNVSYHLNYLTDDNKHRIHAERAAIEKYEKIWGDVPEGSVIVTTLSPCSEHMADREGKSCTDLINDKGIKRVYCGYFDPTQIEKCNDRRKFALAETKDHEIKERCRKFAEAFL